MAKIIDLDRLSRFKDKLDVELDKKANVNGNYPTMTVGVAEQLQNVSENTGSTQTDAFLFQGTGTNNNTTATPTAPIANHLELRGNSVAWNQLIANGNFADSSGWVIPSSNQPYTSMSISSNKCTLTATANAENWYTQILRKTSVAFINTHKYLFIATVKSNASLNISVYNQTTRSQFQLTANTRKVISAKWTATSSDTQIQFAMGDTALSGDTLEIENVMLIDLSLLGKEYDDYVSFARDYPLPYYAYNTGELRNCSSKALETIGQNQWDEQLEIGGLDSSSGVPFENSNNLRSKNFTKVIPGFQYRLSSSNFTNYSGIFVYEYDGSQNFIGANSSSVIFPNTYQIITLHDNCEYIKLRITNSVAYSSVPLDPQIMFCLYWGSGEDYSYKPFEKHTYQLPILDEPLKSAGSAYDILKADGTLIRNVGVVDLGTLDWSYNSSVNNFTSSNITNIKQVSGNTIIFNGCCSKYIPDTFGHTTLNATDKTMSLQGGGSKLWVYDSGAGTDAATFKTAMSGVYLYYELATPNETQDTSRAFNQTIVVDDMGTMRFVPSDDASEPIIPQGNKFFYPADYVLFIDDIYNRSKDGGDDADANNFVVQSELSAEGNRVDGLYAILKENVKGALKHELEQANNIDFANIDTLDLGDLTWYYGGTNFYSYISGTNIKATENAGVLCPLYKSVQSSGFTSTSMSINNNGVAIQVMNSNYNDSIAFKNAMKGVLLAYEKA